MKLLAFAALTFLARTASAATINVTAELTKNGQLLSNLFASVQPGQPIPFRDVSVIPYTDSSKRENGIVKRHTKNLETGFTMLIIPRLTSDGGISYSLKANVVTLDKMERLVDGGLPIDLPRTSDFDFTHTAHVRSGQVTRFYSEDAANGYVLTVTATSQP
jgi:hypothetical protein